MIVRRCSARYYGHRRNLRINFISTRLLVVNYKLSIFIAGYNAGVIAHTLNKAETAQNSYSWVAQVHHVDPQNKDLFSNRMDIKEI